MASEKARFVDDMRHELIQKVSSVMPITDTLLQKRHIGQEAYSEIYAENTNQQKMRSLYLFLNSEAVKAAFYEALQQSEDLLLRELESKWRGSAGATEHFPLGSERADARTLEERWQKNSIKYRTKLADLLRDPELNCLGNGKLFLCTKSEYRIGSGADGTHVYIGMRHEGTELAVKRMVKENHKELENEINILRELEHKNIVRYMDIIEQEEFYYLCLQLCECNCIEYIETNELGPDALKKIAQEVLLGLEALHNAGIIHRDFKPSNILIDIHGNVRLADFGISRKLNRDESTVKTSRTGTRGWEAAEILNGNPDGTSRYKTSSDIQVFLRGHENVSLMRRAVSTVAGMLVYYILSGRNHPFGTHLEVESNIVKGDYKLDKITDVEAKDLVKKMIALEPQDRLSAQEAVAHPYFWDDTRRDQFLRTFGDEESVQKFKNPNDELRNAVDEYKQFSQWKIKIADLIQRERKLPDDFLGLFRFMRNRLVHQKVHFYKHNMYKDEFPEFYISANQLAKDMKWK